MQRKTPSLAKRLRLATAILTGGKAKEFIPALDPIGDGVSFGGTGRLTDYTTKIEQMQANIGWCFVANTAIADTCAAVPLKLFRKVRKGKDIEWEEVKEHEILELIDKPNAAHTGEQLMQLHYTYMNFVGESYIQMIRNSEPFIPEKGKLPEALLIFPAHKVQFNLGDTYSDSTVKLGGQEWPVQAFVRDINPDPDTLYRGRSIIAASATTIDMDNRMKEWNREVFNNGAHPSLIFSTKTGSDMSDEAYARFQQQFSDEHTGAANAHKPLLIENGDAKPYMLSQKDLDFLESRKFSRDEILAMWRVNPYIIGSVEDVNLATAKAARTQHAEINVEPRVRQFVRQLNATFVSVYDPDLRLGFESPVPEDDEAKLKEVEAGVDKWWTKDEARAKYGDEPLPNGAGEQIIVNGIGSMPLEDVIAGAGIPTPAAAPVAPAGKSLRAKQVSLNDFPGLLDDVDMVPDDPGCIMLDTEALPVRKHVDAADDDLVDSTDMDHSPVPGEDVPHITLLYGLLENGNVWKDKVDTLLKDWKPGGITIAKVGAFDLGDSYAIVAHIKKTPELVDGHERLTLLPHIQTYSEYLPHMTLAYVQHDQAVADKWVKALGKQYNGKTIKAKGINYGDLPEDTGKKALLPTRGKKKELTPEQQRDLIGNAKAKRYVNHSQRYEQAILVVCREQFNRQRDEALSNLDTSKIGKSYTRKDWLNDIVDWTKSADSFHKALAPHIYTAIIETGKEAIAEVGQESSMFDPFTPAIKNYFESRALKVVKDVNDETKKQLRATLPQGVQDGESGYELRARVEAVFGNASTMRADRIARTETSRAQGFGDIQAWTQSGVVSGKEWFTAEDERVCPFCDDMDGKVVGLEDNFFDKGDTLEAGGKTLDLSYDDVPSAPLHVGCRCVLLPVRD